MKPAAALLLASALVAVPVAVSQNPATPPSGLIVGQVVDAAGRPVPEAIVTLSSPNVEGGRRVMADGSGRFFFTELPGGEYSLVAAKPGYLVGRVGQPRPDGPIGPLRLREGERRADARIVIWKHAVITGVVLDDAGEPLVRAGVIALRRTYVAGRLSLAFYRQTASTDDRGRFRFASLVPGDYLVAVPTTLTSTPASMLRDYFDGPDRADLKGLVTATAQIYGGSETSRPGDPRNLHVGDHVVATFGIMPTPPAALADGRLAVYQTTLFRGAHALSRATIVSVASGEERSGVDLQLAAVPGLRVAGRVMGPDGAPPALTFLRLVPVGQDDAFMDRELEAANGTADGSGAFSLYGVPPGQYVLKAAVSRGTSGAAGGTRAASPELLWASEPLSVGDRDVLDLAVRLKPGLPISGRIEFRGAGPAPTLAAIAKLRVTLTSTVTGGRGVTAAVDERGVFTASVLPASFAIEPAVPSGWWLHSVVQGGRDLTHQALAVSAPVGDLVVSFTDRPSRVSGAIRTARGAPGSLALVVALPVVEGRGAGPVVRDHTIRATGAGTYEIPHLPPGEYLIAAVDDTAAGFRLDAATLDRLRSSAVRVTIGDGVPRVLDLKVSELR